MAKAKSSNEEHKYYKAQGPQFESTAKFYFQSFKMSVDQANGLNEKMLSNFQAMRKFESSKNMGEPQMIIDPNDYMKYGPSDDED